MRKPPILQIVIPVVAAASILWILPTKSAYLDTAMAGLNWIESHAVEETEGASLYPNVPDESDSLLRDTSLYHGQAGRIHALLQAAVATRDPKWEAAARRALGGLDECLARIAPIGYRDAGLYTGIAGAASVHLQASRVLEDGDRFRRRALSLADSIVAWSRLASSGATWNGVTDMISGAAGTGLLLLEAFTISGDRAYLDRAIAAARWLMDTAIEEPETGGNLYWRISDEGGLHYPNFSHGTAGVAFFLGRAARYAADNSMGEAANLFSAARASGISWLQAHGEADGCVVFHHEGDGEDLQYLGWCHGPAGTGRLFMQESGLPQPEESMVQALSGPAEAGARYLIDSGLQPGESPSGYWNNLGICCGTAGILNYLLDLYLVTDEKQYLDGAKECGDILMSRAVQAGDGMVKWPVAEHRTRPDFIQSQTGYMQGAAGISASLIRLYLVLKGRSDEILRFPDEPVIR